MYTAMYICYANHYYSIHTLSLAVATLNIQVYISEMHVVSRGSSHPSEALAGSYSFDALQRLGARYPICLRLTHTSRSSYTVALKKQFITATPTLKIALQVSSDSYLTLAGALIAASA